MYVRTCCPSRHQTRSWIHGCPGEDIVRREAVDAGLRSLTACHANGREDMMDSKTKHGRHAASDARHRPRCATDDEHVMTERRGEPGQRRGKTKRNKHDRQQEEETEEKHGAKSKTQKRKRERERQTHRQRDRERKKKRKRERRVELVSRMRVRMSMSFVVTTCCSVLLQMSKE